MCMNGHYADEYYLMKRRAYYGEYPREEYVCPFCGDDALDEAIFEYEVEIIFDRVFSREEVDYGIDWDIKEIVESICEKECRSNEFSEEEMTFTKDGKGAVKMKGRTKDPDFPYWLERVEKNGIREALYKDLGLKILDILVDYDEPRVIGG